jgi:sigma-B regulation protein RsbU (phosphoserine phosphatase)
VPRRALPARIARFIIGEAGEDKLRLIVEISRKISTATELKEVLDFILDAARKEIDYDAAGIFLFDEESQTAMCAAGRGYRESFSIVAPFDRLPGIVGWVISTGESVIAAEVEDNPHYLNLREETHSQLTVPITGADKVLGAFNLESDRADAFTEKDLEWLAVLATQVAISIERARLHQELLEKRRLDEELRIAREVQLSLLPTSAPKLDGLDIAGINIPSRNIGGDYYDFIPIVSGHLGIVIADVAGKGVPASLIMASFRAFLRAEIRNNYSIHTIFAKVNNLLSEILQPHQFVTAFYGVLDLEQRRFTFSNAGHNPPMLLRPDGKWRRLTSGGVVLGIFEGASYDQGVIDLMPGDLFVLYTDGLIEAENKAGQMFGDKRLERLVRANMHLPADELCETIYQEMRRFTKESRLDDDTTIVIAKVLQANVS